MKRPDLIEAAGDKLSRVERFQIRAIRRTIEPGAVNDAVRWCQRSIGARWINFATSKLRHVHGLDRLPPLDPRKSYVCVSNHRSFFDLYIITSYLVGTGRLKNRIIFPVRSEFFYDRPLGFFVNGSMSFFAMYPPIFRDRKRAAANLASLDELSWVLRRGGAFAGIHPEGTRNKGDDPYDLLPAQSGVGRVIHKARVAVLPVFINGLGNDIVKQVRSNFDGSGRDVIIVFGEPLELGDLLDRPGSPRTYRTISERCLQAIGELGREERELRASRH